MLVVPDAGLEPMTTRLSVFLVLQGMPNDGFALTAACFEHVYNQMGLHYQTPEAFTRGMTFRSLGYMRPLAIWSVQRAVELARAKRLKTGAIHE